VWAKVLRARNTLLGSARGIILSFTLWGDDAHPICRISWWRVRQSTVGYES
jgi:hypothetical protein